MALARKVLLLTHIPTSSIFVAKAIRDIFFDPRQTTNRMKYGCMAKRERAQRLDNAASPADSSSGRTYPLIRDKCLYGHLSRIKGSGVRRAQNLFYGDKPMRTQTIGAELEGGMVNAKTGCPVISLEVLGGGIKDPTIPFQELTSDAGISTFEAVSTPCVNGRHITRSLDGALGWMPSGYEPKFDPMPFGPRVAIADKERYGVLREGARREHPNGFDGIFKVAPLCASQFHIGVRGLDTHTVQLLNVLNASAPHMRTQGIREYGLTHLVGHNSCWFDWFDPRRGPAPRWFSGVEELSNFARSIPKMTTKVDGRWVLAPEGEGSDLYDPEAVTTIWWAVRPRLDLGTFEMRPGWPSMKPTQMGLLADEILVMLDAFWQLVPEVVEGRDSASTRELVRKLSQVTWLVPETLPSDDMWMKQFLH